jgi:sialate O-acetylesterase
MALALKAAYNWTDTIEPASNRPEIRLFTVVKQGSSEPLPHLLGAPAWEPSTPAVVGQFSGVCYLTALELRRLHHGGDPDAVYGLIDSSVGSTDVQSWMAAEARASALETCWEPSNATALPPSHSHAPGNATNASELWNAMVAPLVPFALSAVLWDQVIESLSSAFTPIN